MATTPLGELPSSLSLLPEVLHPEFVGEAVPHSIVCPHCAYDVTLLVDASAGRQRYTEDCPTCCRPIDVSVEARDYRIDRVLATKLF
jgi:hypothetical protein